MTPACPRCGVRLAGEASACPGCGRSTADPAPGDALVNAGGGRALEPEVLESLDAVGGTGFTPPARHVGCSLGPGCGCIGLPLAAAAGVIVSALVALLWVLSLGRVPASILRLVRRAGRGASQGQG